jgi:hypothetical protein
MQAEGEQRQVSEREELHRWRQDRLEELGVPYPESWALAVLDVSWHEAERLIVAGCPPRLVFRIVT